MTGKTCGCSTETCGCCEGTQKLTPMSTVNRPGLDALRYRVGTHGAFFETMKARLANLTVEGAGADGQTIEKFQPLLGLTTRKTSDTAIALLDGWATVGDVLTFYQERIANEGYLRTATERRSILELARLVGYKLRPGVAATVFVAYTLEDKQIEPVEIPAGARSQSIPGPGELPQSFETSDSLVARTEWNNLQVRLQRPQKIILKDARTVEKIYVAGANLNLKTGDLVMLVFEGAADPVVRTVAKCDAQFPENRTEIQLQPDNAPPSAGPRTVTDPSRFVQSLLKPRIPQAASSLQLGRSLQSALSEKTDAQPQLLVNFAPALKDSFYTAWASASVATEDPALKAIYVFRMTAPLFGASAAKQPAYFTDDSPEVIPIGRATGREAVGSDADVPHFKGQLKPQEKWDEWRLAADEKNDALFLDQAHESILPLSYVLINTLTKSGETVQQVRQVLSTNTSQRTAYGLSGSTTRLELDKSWWPKTSLPEIAGARPEIAEALRGTLIQGQSEELTLAEEPITEPVKVTKEDPAAGIVLAELYNELTSGRWIILSGERRDIPGVTGVKGNELLMISGLRQDFDKDLPGDKTHTTLLLATPTAYSYKRDSLTIYGNVVKATHGETRNEPLGSGDGSQTFQSFQLQQPPLTFVPAPTAAGAASTLEVYVNDVEWQEADTLAGLGPRDRKFITKTADDDKTTVIFGNGAEGSRLPTGVLNVKSIYRNGIGKGGNVLAEQISMLQTRPLGVKAVINPMRASGGANKEDRDQARENVPIGVMALDRLVSLQDYADFTRTFAGIAKAAAAHLSDGNRQLVHLTIAGIDDIPIDPESDLYRNLLIALQRLGDLSVAVQVDSRELEVLVLSANINLSPGYLWDPVVTEIRTALLDRFGFQKRALGQAALLSEIISAIQNVKGVAYVDVDTFGGIPEKTNDADGTRRLLNLEELSAAVANLVSSRGTAPPKPLPIVKADLAGVVGGVLHPAQLAIFTPAVPDTIVLNQIK